MSVYVVAQARCAFAGPFLLPLAVLVLELCRLWLKCVCKEKSRTSSNGVLSHLRSESVPVHVYRNFEFLPGTFGPSSLTSTQPCSFSTVFFRSVVCNCQF